MAIPLTASRLLAALRAEGCRVVEVAGWRTHNRNTIGAWGPVHGTMIHHTVTSGAATTVRILRDGYSGLPGPLSLGGITKDGTVHLIGYGRANHAGGGDPAVLQRVIAEDYGDRPPKPTVGNRHGVDGNARFYGFECENLGDGDDPWPAVQLDAIERANAALLRAHGWSATSAIGHLEWSSDKIDPRGFSMVEMRARIADRLTHPAGWTRGTASTPPKETTMAISEADAKKIARSVLTLDWEIDAPWGSPTNQHWMLKSCVTHLMKAVLRTEKAVQELAAQGAARDAVLARLAEGEGMSAAEIERAAQAAATAALDRLAIALAAEEEG
jgi:hypothetical protein